MCLVRIVYSVAPIFSTDCFNFFSTHLSVFSIRSIGSFEDFIPRINAPKIDQAKEILGNFRDQPEVAGLYAVMFGLYIIGMGLTLRAQRKAKNVFEYKMVDPVRYIVTIKTTDPNFKMANVKVKIFGEDNETDYETLRRWFQRGRYVLGSDKEFCVFGNDVGVITSVSLISDPQVQWSFESVEVLEVTRKQLYRFSSLTPTFINTSIQLENPKIKKKRQTIMQYCLYETVEGFVLGHKFWSIFFAPFHSSVTRYERITLLLQSFTANLFTNALFYDAYPVESVIELISVAFYSWLMSGSFTFFIEQVFKRSIRTKEVAFTNIAKSKEPVSPEVTTIKTAALDVDDEVSEKHETKPAHALMELIAKRNRKSQGKGKKMKGDTKPQKESLIVEKIKSLPKTFPAWMRYVAWGIAFSSIFLSSFFSWLIILDPTFSGKVWSWLVGSLVSTVIDLFVWFPMQLMGKFVAVPILASIFFGGI